MRINDHELHVETYGPESGDAIIFLHHGLGSTQAWEDQITAFIAAGFRLVIYDRWGYGRSQARTNLAVPGFDDDLADLNGLIVTLALRQAILIGHSDGGTIALYFAARDPEKVKALVTIGAHIYLEPKMEPTFREIRKSFENKPRFRKGLRRAHGKKFKSTFYNWVKGWNGPDALDWDMCSLLPRVLCPTLVIQGEDDEHATPQHAVDIARNIPKAELWLVPGACHMFPQEMVEQFNQRVIAFLQSVNMRSKQSVVPENLT